MNFISFNVPHLIFLLLIHNIYYQKLPIKKILPKLRLLFKMRCDRTNQNFYLFFITRFFF